PSQNLFESRLDEVCRHSTRPVAVLVVLLRRYHEILEALGHLAGPVIAQSVARTLEILLPSASVARLTESEFGVLLQVAGDEREAEIDKVVMHIRYALSAGLYVDAQEVFPDVFIGIAVHPRDGTPAEVLKRAAAAAGSARQEGATGYFRYFTEEMEAFSKK